MTYSRFRGMAALTLAAALLAVGIAACGSSNTTSSSSAAASAPAGSGAAAGSGFNRSKLAACLKAHGLTLPSRTPGARRPPSGSAPQPGFFFGGGGAGGARGRFAANPKFRAAFQACGGGRGFAGRRAALSHAAVTKFVACVRQHGYNLPAPNYSGHGSIFPAGIERNQKFQTAARACEADLRPTGGPAAPGSPPGSGSATTSGA